MGWSSWAGWSSAWRLDASGVLAQGGPRRRGGASMDSLSSETVFAPPHRLLRQAPPRLRLLPGLAFLGAFVVVGLLLSPYADVGGAPRVGSARLVVRAAPGALALPNPAPVGATASAPTRPTTQDADALADSLAANTPPMPINRRPGNTPHPTKPHGHKGPLPPSYPGSHDGHGDHGGQGGDGNGRGGSHGHGADSASASSPASPPHNPAPPASLNLGLASAPNGPHVGDAGSNGHSDNTQGSVGNGAGHGLAPAQGGGHGESHDNGHSGGHGSGHEGVPGRGH